VVGKLSAPVAALLEDRQEEFRARRSACHVRTSDRTLQLAAEHDGIAFHIL
jgi:hypothetical protein